MATIDVTQGLKGVRPMRMCRRWLMGRVGRTDRTRYSANQGFNGGKVYLLSLSVITHSTGMFPPAKTKVVGFHVKILEPLIITQEHTHSIRMTVGTSLSSTFQHINWVKTIPRFYTLIASSSTVIDAAQHHVEFKIFSDTTNGTFNLKLDGVEVVF